MACSAQYESLRNEHGKDWSSTWHVVHNMANRVESAEERQERLRRRRERYRIRRERETDEERGIKVYKTQMVYFSSNVNYSCEPRETTAEVI